MRKLVVASCLALALSCKTEDSNLAVEPQFVRKATKITCSGHSQDDVRETLFRYLVSQSRNVTPCLAIEEKDLSDEFMERFDNLTVSKLSECSWKEGPVKDNHGKDAVVLGIVKIVEITPDLVVVEAYKSFGDLNAAGFEYIVRLDCVWKVIGEQMLWIS